MTFSWVRVPAPQVFSPAGILGFSLRGKALSHQPLHPLPSCAVLLLDPQQCKKVICGRNRHQGKFYPFATNWIMDTNCLWDKVNLGFQLKRTFGTSVFNANAAARMKAIQIQRVGCDCCFHVWLGKAKVGAPVKGSSPPFAYFLAGFERSLQVRDRNCIVKLCDCCLNKNWQKHMLSKCTPVLGSVLSTSATLPHSTPRKTHGLLLLQLPL